MTHSFVDQLKNHEWHRAGICFAEASGASRSEADSNAMRAIFSCFGFSLQNTAILKRLVPSWISGWTHSTRIRFQQFPDQKLREINHAFSLAGHFDPNRVADKCFAHEPLSPAPLDLPVASHAAHGQATGVAQQHMALRRRLRMINLSWCPLPQPLMRSNSVVGLYPTVRPSLLSSQVTRSRSGGLRFQNPMHLFVRPILFRMSRFCELDSNSQSRPPGTQSRKPDRPFGSKGVAIVHTNHSGVAILSKQSQEDSAGADPTLSLEQTHRQQISTEQIAHRQGVYTLTIPRSKPAFEVHCPHLVASLCTGQATGPQLRPSRRALTLTTAQLHPPEPLADGPRTGNRFSRIISSQACRQLPASPTAVSPPQNSNPPQPLRGDSPRRMMRPASPVSHTLGPFPLETRPPFVAASAAHSKSPTQLRHALLGLQRQLHELQPSHHRRELFPRHARGRAEK